MTMECAVAAAGLWGENEENIGLFSSVKAEAGQVIGGES